MKRLAFIAALCATTPTNSTERLFMVRSRLCLCLALIVSTVLTGIMAAVWVQVIFTVEQLNER